MKLVHGVKNAWGVRFNIVLDCIGSDSRLRNEAIKSNISHSVSKWRIPYDETEVTSSRTNRPELSGVIWWGRSAAALAASSVARARPFARHRARPDLPELPELRPESACSCCSTHAYYVYLLPRTLSVCDCGGCVYMENELLALVGAVKKNASHH